MFEKIFEEAQNAIKFCKRSAQGTCGSTSPHYFLREIITNSVSILNGKPFLLEVLVDAMDQSETNSLMPVAG